MSFLRFQSFDQTDPRWSTILLGFNTDPQFTIGRYGCLLSCLAMVCHFFKVNENPKTLNEKLKEINGFTSGGEYIWGSIEKLYPKIKETKVTGQNSLKHNELMILEIDTNPENSSFDSHFVLARSFEKGAQFPIIDPLGGKPHPLNDYLKPGEEISTLIRQYILYSFVK